MPQLSVIIPFYNASRYLKKTTESLFKQSLLDIEYIFVNDGSTDDSKSVILDVLSSFPLRQPQVIICNSSQDGKNCGIAHARQAGLDIAQGEYVIFCDSDDWVDENYYEQLYHTAVSNNATMVVGDHCVETVCNTTKITSPEIKNWDGFKSFPHWFHLSLCNRLIKLSLIRDNNISFFEGINFSEDYGFIMKIYYYSQSNCNVHSNSLYHYNKTNEQSLTHTLSSSSQQQRIKCINMLESFFASKNESLTYCNIHNIEKYAAKDALLTINKFSLWRKTFPEITKMVLRDHNRNILYKITYILGQYISWRILWLYHSLHKLIH